MLGNGYYCPLLCFLYVREKFKNCKDFVEHRTSERTGKMGKGRGHSEHKMGMGPLKGDMERNSRREGTKATLRVKVVKYMVMREN